MSIMVKLSQLAFFDLNAFFNGIWGLIIRSVYILFFVSLAKVADVVQLLFRKFAGLDTVIFDSATWEGDIVLAFLNNKLVLQIFVSMFFLAVVLLFITTFVAIYKTEWTPLSEKGGNSKKKIIGTALRSLTNFVAVPVISILGLIVGNAVLSSLDRATSMDGYQISISRQVFLTAATNCNRAADTSSSFYRNMVGPDRTGRDGRFNFEIFVDDVVVSATSKTAADKIDEAFASAQTVSLKANDDRYLLDTSGYFSREFYNNINLNGKSEITFDIYNAELVFYFYDLTQFNYLIGVIALLFVCYIFLHCLMGLIKRIFVLVTLFLISAPIVAVAPLNQNVLKNWRKEFVKSALASYSIIVTLNIFFIVLPMLLKIQLFVGTSSWIKFCNYLSQVFIICSGCLFIREISKTVAGIIEADDIGNGGDKAFSSLTKKFAAGAGVVAGVGMAAGGKLLNKSKNLTSQASSFLSDPRTAKEKFGDLIAGKRDEETGKRAGFAKTAGRRLASPFARLAFGAKDEETGKRKGLVKTQVDRVASGFNKVSNTMFGMFGGNDLDKGHRRNAFMKGFTAFNSNVPGRNKNNSNSNSSGSSGSQSKAKPGSNKAGQNDQSSGPNYKFDFRNQLNEEYKKDTTSRSRKREIDNMRKLLDSEYIDKELNVNKHIRGELKSKYDKASQEMNAYKATREAELQAQSAKIKPKKP